MEQEEKMDGKSVWSVKLLFDNRITIDSAKVKKETKNTYSLESRRLVFGYKIRVKKNEVFKTRGEAIDMGLGLLARRKKHLELEVSNIDEHIKEIEGWR